jgi:protein-S-isoprenylcysteine O-methyltransferase Ste14
VRGAWGKIARRIRVPMGFLFAAFFLWRARPSAASLVLALVLILPGLLLRAYASGYVTKNAALTVSGPYAYTRNPLYLGSSMIAFGFALAARSLWIAVSLVVLFGLIYGPTIVSEERFLRCKFPEFDAYAYAVPRLLPRFTPWRPPNSGSGSFSVALYLQHREYNASLGVCAIYAALIASLLLRH